jgi:transposase
MTNKHSNHDLKIRAVKAVLAGQSIDSVSKTLKFDRSTIHRWLQQYKKAKNLENLKPKIRSGRPRKSSNKIQKLLLNDLLKPASKFGFETDFWTCRRLIQHVNKKFKIKISQSTMWRLLRESTMTYQKPEKRYKEADPLLQEKWIENELSKIKRLARKLNAILYFEDEASIQLAPVIGKTWAPKGQTPIQKVTGNRGSIAAISAVSSDGRLIFNLRRGKFKSQEIINFLDQMLKHHPRRHLIVVMDQAKPHVSKMTKAYIGSQKRLHVFYIPSRSPELNPDEKVWNHLKNQELKSHQATNLADLEKLTRIKLRKMSKNSSLLKGIFLRSDIAKYMN